MMELDRLEKQSLKIHQRIRKARFIEYEENKTFKYQLVFKKFKRLIYYFFKFVIDINNILKKFISRLRLFSQEFRWDEIFWSLFLWITETFFEGITVNFVFWALFGWSFKIITIFAYGIIIVQSLSILKRIINYGKHNKIPNKNK